MRANTCLVVDVWEGQLEVDEAVLKANGVAGMGIRLNDMNGGHHKDTGFDKQWLQAANFVRFPYFVYNPWVTGQANFAWLAANAPAQALAVAVDVEVRKTGYSASIYAGELVKFLNLCKSRWKVIIYTAQWFLPYLSSWPKVDYWWAQYPDTATFFNGVNTWDLLKTALDKPKLAKPFNANLVPGTLKLWQFSGDALTLPGNTRKIDVNLFFGTVQDLQDYFGNTPQPPVYKRTFDVPASGKYYQTLHDYENINREYKPRSIALNYKKDPPYNALPETIPLLNKKEQFFPLPKEWQLWWFELLQLASGEMFSDAELKKRWESLTDDSRAFTDNRSRVNGYADFVLGVNVDKKPMMLKSLTTGGNIVKVLAEDVDRLTIECLNFSQSPPRIEDVWEKKPWLYQWASQETVVRIPNKTYVVLPFPQLNPYNGSPVPVGSLDGTQVIELSNVKKLGNGGRYNIYNSTVSTISGLYGFTSINYWERPGGGPLVLPMSRVLSLGDNMSQYDWTFLKPIITKLNPTNPAAVSMISAPDWGPSKGLDGNLIKWIALLWPGRNVVRITEIVEGWGRVDGCPLSSAGTLNAADNPDLVHMVYDYHPTNGWGERAKPVYVPILEGPWWVDMRNLVSLDAMLPKIVKIRASPRLNVRSDARIDAPVVGSKNYGEGVVVEQVKTGKSGIWGRITGGWIALRNYGQNWTDWKI